MWLRELHGREDGPPPPVDLAQEIARGTDVRRLIDIGTATAVHDISNGGLLVALAEMALAGNIGCGLTIQLDTAKAFGEDQGRYILCARADELIENAVRIGIVGGSLVAGIEIADLREASDSFFRDWMES